MLLSEKPTSHADMQLFVSVLIRRLVKANKASFKSHLSVSALVHLKRVKYKFKV